METALAGPNKQQNERKRNMVCMGDKVDLSRRRVILASRRKRWWVVTWDVPTFGDSPGRLVYTEVVKARHPKIALWKASRRFIVKMQWALDNRMKSIGGEKTMARLLVGEFIQAGWVIRQDESSLIEVGSDPSLNHRLDLLACTHPRTEINSRQYRTRSAVLQLELSVCQYCGAEEVVDRFVVVRL